MPKYLIERHIPGAGNLTTDDLAGIARTSNSVLEELGAGVQWVHSHVTGDRITCVYIAPNAELVREHARRGGFPADRVDEIVETFDASFAKNAQAAGAAG